jgi:DNA-binding phage protein
MKKILATLVTAVVIGAGGMAVASAADSPKTTTAPSTATASAKPKAAVKTVLGVRARVFAFTTAAKTIGISPAELLKEMQGGHSVADVATAHHVEPQTVVNAIVTGADAKIQQAVTSDKISSAEGAKLEQLVATDAPKFVNATLKQLAHTKLVAGAIDVSAKTIGVTPQALRQAIASGHSVAQVATAHSVSPTTVVNALVSAGNARIDTAVANHHLSAARAAQLKARLPKLAQRFVDFTRNGAKTPAAAA